MSESGAAAMRGEPLFSLILATYGRVDALAPLVSSLVAQSYRNFEVVLADQNGDDRVVTLVEPLRAAGLLGSHLRLPEPNLSAARNAGLAAARGRYVAFPDDDCWYEPGTLAHAAAIFAAHRDLQGIAARWAEAPTESADLSIDPISPEAMRRFRGGNVASITLFLERAAVQAIGGFDERIGVGRWYGAAEETDLVLALVARGHKIRHARDVVVHHAFDAEAANPPRPDLERKRARGTGALYAKHRLPGWVVARGILAPLLAVPGPNLALGAARSLGRLEGMLRWSLGRRHDPGRRAITSTSLETKNGSGA